MGRLLIGNTDINLIIKAKKNMANEIPITSLFIIFTIYSNLKKFIFDPFIMPHLIYEERPDIPAIIHPARETVLKELINICVIKYRTAVRSRMFLGFREELSYLGHNVFFLLGAQLGVNRKR